MMNKYLVQHYSSAMERLNPYDKLEATVILALWDLLQPNKQYLSWKNIFIHPIKFYQEHQIANLSEKLIKKETFIKVLQAQRFLSNLNVEQSLF